jgi:hypothetical protein
MIDIEELANMPPTTSQETDHNIRVAELRLELALVKEQNRLLQERSRKQKLAAMGYNSGSNLDTGDYPEVGPWDMCAD